MDLDGTSARFSISVEDISDVWGTLKPVLESRTAWRNLQLRNRVGGSVNIAELQVCYVLQNNARLTQLRQHSQSPATWFRNPYVHLILVSSDDADGYKKGLRNQLRQAIDSDRDLLGGAPEFVIACLQPFAADANAKAAKKVFDMVKSDIGTRKKDRVVRIEIGPRGAVSIACINDLEKQMADALKLTFSARQAAYDDAIRKLSSERQMPGWDFGNLFLVKDSLAVMLESAGLLEDALREYAELDALYNTTLLPLDSPNAPPFGASAPGDDTAQLMRATWREARKTVYRSSNLLQFDFQQFLFACQARILLKLNRPAEVIERGIAAIEALQVAMDHPSVSSKLPPLFKEAWTFSACISLATTTVRIGPPPPTPKSQPPFRPSGSFGLLASTTSANHRRALSELPTDQRVPRAPARQTKSLNATDFATISEGSTGEGSTRSEDKSDAESDEDSEPGHRRLQSNDRGVSLESATTRQRARLKPVKTRTPDATHRPLGSSADGGAAHSQKPATPSEPQSAVSFEPSIDWQLGVNGYLTAEALSDLSEGGLPKAEAEETKQRRFWSLLGHLFTRARDALSAFNDFVETVEYQSTASTPQGGLSTDINSGSLSPLPLRSPSLRSGLSRGHLLASLDVENGAPGGLGSRISSSSNLAVEAARPASKVEGVPGRANDSGAAPVGSQHFRTLSRFAREAGLRTPSASSLFHHARRGSTASEAPSTAMSEADSIGSFLREPDSVAPQPEVLLRNVRLVEREVETASESSGSPSSAKISERSGIFKEKFSWLTEWRLRLALGSEHKYQELWINLSGAAALCYFSAGWKRQAHLTMAGVAEVLVQQGQLEAAISLMQVSIKQLLVEKWLQLSTRLLQLQLKCHRRLKQVADPGDCLELLALLEAVDDHADTKSEVHQALLESVKSDSPEQQTSLSHSRLLHAEPVGSHYSRFFGQSEAGGETVTSPSLVSPCPGMEQGKGAHLACVGDIVTVPVVINSRLPGPIPISQCRLALSILQEVMVVRSPRASSGQDIGFTRGQGHMRSMSVRSMDTIRSAAVNLGSKNTSVTSFTGMAAPSSNAIEPVEAQKFGSRWQEAEEIACPLVQSRSDGDATSDIVTPITGAQAQDLVLVPGQNLLKFQVTPLKQGLYALKHCTFSLGRAKVKVSLHVEDWGAPTRAGFAEPPVRGQLGSCNRAGRLEEEAVVIQVQRTSQRVKSTAVLPNSAVVAEARQWLGVAIRPLHDRLEGARVQIYPSNRMSTSSPASEHIELSILKETPAFIAPLSDAQGRYPWQASEAGEASTSGRTSEASDPPVAEIWKRNGNEALPAWAATQPSIIWLPIQAGRLQGRLQKVRVSPYTTHVPLRTVSKGLGEVTSPVMSPLRSPDSDPQIATQAKAAAQLDVNIEYNADCPRGSSSRLTLAVLPSIRVFVTGKELPGKRVVLQISLTSNLSVPLSLLSFDLTPQPGFGRDPAQLGVSSLLPLEVPPMGAASLLSFLTVVDSQSEGALAKRPSSRLQSSLEFRLQTPIDRPPLTAYREASGSMPVPPGTEEQILTQQHHFVLDLGAANSAPLSTVYIRLLGPFSAKVGEATTFCWRLERSSSFVAGQGDTDILHYSIKLEGDSRRAGQEWQGQIRLPLRAGSIATVEATWTPQAPGMLPMPLFMLPDVPHQEMFDVGDPSYANHTLTIS